MTKSEETTIKPTLGKHWWVAYPDGCVWPAEVLRASTNPFEPHHFRIRPVHPAPDAGEERSEYVRNIYDAAFMRPDGRKMT